MVNAGRVTAATGTRWRATPRTDSPTATRSGRWSPHGDKSSRSDLPNDEMDRICALI